MSAGPPSDGTSAAEPAVPHWLPDALVRRPLIEVGADRALVRFPGCGRVLVPARGAPVRSPEPGVGPDALGFLDDVVHALGAVLAGRIPLRASVVEVDGRALVIGADGVLGRSTVAAALWARGHRFVADGVAVVHDTPTGPVVEGPPGGPVLWPDAVERLGLDPEAGAPVRAGLPQRRFPVAPVSGPLPVGAIVLLGRAKGSQDAGRLTGFDAMDALFGACWHRFAIAVHRSPAEQFAWAVSLARQVPIATIGMAHDRADPHTAADAALAVIEPEPGRP